MATRCNLFKPVGALVLTASSVYPSRLSQLQRLLWFSLALLVELEWKDG
jgi:hypothetical protein